MYIDDDGSGLAPDESSGSGWGPGPGPDDEDGRGGSGDAPDGDTDDEDYVRTTTTTAAPPTEPAVPFIPIEPRNQTPTEGTFDLGNKFIQPEISFSTESPEIDFPLKPIPADFDIIIRE